MLTVRLDGFDSLLRKTTAAPRQIEIAAQRALVKTAQAVKDAEIDEMRRVFDRPTRWTLGAMKVKPTSRFEVAVGILDPDGFYRRAANYLGTQISGGQRHLKAMERALQQYGIMPTGGWFAVPGAGAKIDTYGNMSSGQIRQILSWFDAAERWAGSTQNMGQAGRDKRRKGTKRNIGFEYFAVIPGRTNHLGNRNNLKQPGIYQRFFFGHGKAIKPVLIYVKGARYQARFDFEKVAHKVANAMWQSEFDKALQVELFK